MKKSILIILFLGIFIACHKTEVQAPVADNSATNTSKATLSLADVKAFYTSQVSNSILQTESTAKSFNLSKLNIPWNSAESISNKTGNYWLIHLSGQPTFQKVKQGYRKVAFLRDSTGSIHARILEIIPDGLYYQRKQRATTADFTGRIFIYDEQYKLLGGQVLSNGKVIGRIKASTGSSVNSTKLQTDNVEIIASCDWQDSSYIDGDGVFTVYSEQICAYAVMDDGYDSGYGFDPGIGDYAGDGGGGGGDATSAPEVSNLPNVSTPKIDPKTFMNCFGTIPDAGAKMTVTIYVQEPFPGTSFNIGPNSVGHVAIGLTKSSSSGTITQVVGFYPDASGLSKMNAPSKIGNNGGDLSYDVSITYNIIPSDFAKIVNYVSNPPGTYDLMSFNCTNFAYHACLAGGITLPDPTSIVGLPGTGGATTAMTPAGLGNSIENLQGAMNVNTNGGTTPNSKGPCN